MSESPFLKDELGPLLAKGLAEVAIAQPQDPVEFLGLWLLHQQQKAAAAKAKIAAAAEVEAERDEWSRGRAVREKDATSVIQREWRAHVREAAEAKRRDAALKEIFASIEERAEELVPEEEPADPDAPESERAAEVDRLAAAAQFGRSRLFMEVLDKSYVGDFKKINGANKSAVTVLKCLMYLQGAAPKQVDSWDKVRTLIKPYTLALFLGKFHPCGTPLEKKRTMTRVRRLMSTVDADSVQDCGVALNAVRTWLADAVAFREARDEHLRQLRAAGKEGEDELEEDDEEAENEERDRDPDEEVVRQQELELKRQQELDAAEEAEEGAEADE